MSGYAKFNEVNNITHQLENVFFISNISTDEPRKPERRWRSSSSICKFSFFMNDFKMFTEWFLKNRHKIKTTDNVNARGLGGDISIRA